MHAGTWMLTSSGNAKARTRTDPNKYGKTTDTHMRARARWCARRRAVACGGGEKSIINASDQKRDRGNPNIQPRQLLLARGQRADSKWPSQEAECEQRGERAHKEQNSRSNLGVSLKYRARRKRRDSQGTRDTRPGWPCTPRQPSPEAVRTM
eukprot:6184828-Pleurochrysis_carterae.AAC.1